MRKSKDCHLMVSGIPIQWAQTSYIAKLGDILEEFRKEHTEKMVKLMDKIGQIPIDVSEFITENYEGQALVSANQLQGTQRN